MSARRGIGILDLLTLPAQIRPYMPEQLVTAMNAWSVIEHSSVTTDAAIIHHGRLQSLADLADTNLDRWVVQLPGLTTGLPFRMAERRRPLAAGQNLEPLPTELVIDIFVDPIKFVIPGLRPGYIVDRPGQAIPRTLVERTPVTDDQGRVDPTHPENRVWFVARGVLRIRVPLPDGNADISVIDAPDPLDLDAVLGAVMSMQLEPPHALFGSSRFGMTFDRLILDMTNQYSPVEALAHGFGPEWVGAGIKEATFYCPPDTAVVGPLSIGLHDAWFGSPFGLVGEIHTEFGRLPESALIMRVQQRRATTWENADIVGGVCRVEPDANGDATVRLFFDPLSNPQPSALWRMRDRAPWSGSTSGELTVRDGDDLEYVPFIGDAHLPTRIIRFATQDRGGVAAPRIDVQTSRGRVENVVDISGAWERIRHDVLVFHAHPPPAAAMPSATPPRPAEPPYRWYLSGQSEPVGEGSSCNADVLRSLGPGDEVVLRVETSEHHTRHLLIRAREDGDVLYGRTGQVVRTDGTAVAVNAVAPGTQDLATFHRTGQRDRAATGTAPDQRVVNGVLTVGAGELATAYINVAETPPPPRTEPPPTRTEPALVAQARVYFPFSISDRTDGFDGWLPPPATASGPPAGTATHDLAGWIAACAANPARAYVVIGRTDPFGTEARNRTLSAARAAWVAGQLRAHGITQIHAESEHTPPASADVLRGRPTTVSGVNIAANRLDPGAYVLRSGAAPTWIPHDGPRAPDEVSRFRDYRVVDVYAYDPAALAATPPPTEPATPPPGSGTGDPTRPQVNTTPQRSVLVPGEDPPRGAPIARDQRRPMPYVVKIRIKWDSPVVTDWADAIPTLAELLIAWQDASVPLPTGLSAAAPGNRTEGVENRLPVPPPDPARAGSLADNVWEIHAKWTYDPQTHDTYFLMSVAMPAGKRPKLEGTGIGHRVFAVTMMLAPAMLAGINPDDAAGTGVRLGALAAVGALLTAISERGGVEVSRVQTELRVGAEGSLRITCDYSVTLTLDASLFGAGNIRGENLKLKYKNVGLEIDWTVTDPADAVRFFYEGMSVEVENPGRWRITGPLGQLIRIIDTRHGSSSTWIEFDLGFSIDLGVISLEGATVRLIFSDGNWSVELRGLAVGVDIPNVIRGRGALRLGQGGEVRAGIEAAIIPVNVQARAALSFWQDMVAIEVGVVLPVGIPLGPTGLGLYGFSGRFVANGTRDLDPDPDDPSRPDPDIVRRELGWYAKPAEDKYTRRTGQFAFGVGAIIGTLPDGAYTFNAEGSICIELPDPVVIFGIDAKLASKPDVAPRETGGGGGGTNMSLRLLGMTVIDREAFRIAISGLFTIPKTLILEVPIAAYFPFDGGPWYFRVGSDGIAPRSGSAVTLTLLPGSLDLRVWAFLMVESHQLHNLGGEARLSFDGFSIGMGAGADLTFEAGPFKLSVVFRFLVGVGTSPFLLAGLMELRGELSLIIISLSVSAQLYARITQEQVYIEGEVCGEINLVFFSIRGCFNFVYDSGDVPIEVPSPISGVDLVDRLCNVTGRAALPDGAPPAVWPDAIPVIHFTHHVAPQFPGPFTASPREIPGPRWAGATGLKFAYVLDAVELVRIHDDGAEEPLAGALPAAWWMPNYRPPFARRHDDGTIDIPPSQNEGRDLALLSWDPFPWRHVLIDGGASAPGDPAETIVRVCEPSPAPLPACALAPDARPLGRGRFTIATRTGSPPPYVSRFEVELGDAFRTGHLVATRVVDGPKPPPVDDGDATYLLGEIGLTRHPAGRRVLRAPVPTEHGDLDRVVDLAGATHEGRFVAGLPTMLRFRPTLHRPTIALLFKSDAKPYVPWEWREFRDIGKKTALVMAALYGTGQPGGEPGDPPVVYGPDGTRWPVVVREVATARMTFRIAEYTGPDGPCDGATIIPGANRTSLLYVCGVTADALEQQARDQRTRDELRARWNELAAEAAAIGAPPPSDPSSAPPTEEAPRAPAQVLLAPGAQYEVRVTWRGQAWRQTEQELEPPATPADTWTAGTTERFRFRTAAEVAPAPAPGVAPRTADVPPTHFLEDPARGEIDESIFDPLLVRRYVGAFEPAPGLLHFADDEFAVDLQPGHVDQLLALYGHHLAIRVICTSPPPGALVGAEPGMRDDGLERHPLEVDATVIDQPLPLDRLSEGNRRLVEAAAQAGCLVGTPRLGGRRLAMTAPLELDAWYDVVLVAARPGRPLAEDVVLSRNQIHTSRYRDPAAIADALGFGVATPGASPPGDVILGDDAGAQLARLPVEDPRSDSALDTWMIALGIDLPPTTRPRTSGLWLREAGGWQLAGVLLEAEEPLYRPGRPTADPRLAVASVEVHAGGGVLARFTPRVSDARATRVLLLRTTAGGGPLPADVELVLSLSSNHGDAAVGRRPIFPLPVMALAEAV